MPAFQTGTGVRVVGDGLATRFSLLLFTRSVKTRSHKVAQSAFNELRTSTFPGHGVQVSDTGGAKLAKIVAERFVTRIPTVTKSAVTVKTPVFVGARAVVQTYRIRQLTLVLVMVTSLTFIIFVTFTRSIDTFPVLTGRSIHTAVTNILVAVLSIPA